MSTISPQEKVLFFLPSTTGGAERMTVNIAKMLPKNRYEVKFVIVSRTLGTIIDFIPERYEVLHIPIHNIYCMSTLRMARIIMKEHADIVFSSLHYLNYRLIIAAKLTRVKVIVRLNIELGRLHNKQDVKWVKLTYPYADKIIAQQEEMRLDAMRIAGAKGKNTITLHNPLDKDLIDEKSKAHSPFTDNGKQLKYIWAARLSHEKGHDILIKAFAKVHAKRGDAHLYLVGKSNNNSIFEKEIRDLTKQLGISDFVHFVGFDCNPFKWIKYGNVFVMPSRLEGLPNSLIEAMYLGKPVVATRCIPVIDRIVDEGINGYVVPTEDCNALAEAMLKAPHIHDPKMSYQPASKEDFIRLFDEI